jgi:hypothetical protein
VNRAPRLLAAALVPWLLLAAPTAARADGPNAEVKPLADTLSGMARADYAAGRVLFEDGDPASALVKFRSAYEASKDARLLWNMATCEKALRHYSRALALLEEYQREAAPLLTAQDKEDADRVIEALRSLVGNLVVTANEDGATVLVDDQAVGTTPLSPTRVDVGQRKLVVRKTGFKDFTQSFTVAGAGDIRIEANLVREVHEGRLTIHAPEKATIVLDGRTLGHGTWSGTIVSGGHSLRVTATGMRPYQTELFVQDGEQRTIDVKLESESKGGVPWWAWLAGGAAVVAAGTITAVAIGTQERFAAPTEGTMGSVSLTR